MSQATRYKTICAISQRSTLDNDYQAAFYLLSLGQELFEAACDSVDNDGIDFAKLKRATRGFDERTRFIVDIAHNLFSYNSTCKATPYEISRLGYPLMEQVCTAFSIAAGDVRVEIRPNEKHTAVSMVLDDEPYQKKQRAYRDFQQLQAEAIASAQEEADEWER